MLNIRIYRVTSGHRAWFESDCNSWERALTFVPNWGTVRIVVDEPNERVILYYGKAITFNLSHVGF